MKANELMIGDWVYFVHLDGQKVAKKIENIYGSEFNCKTRRNQYDEEVIISGFYLMDTEPIPLTEEILERLGRGRFGNMFCFANSQTVIFVFLEGGLFKFHTNKVDGCYMYGAFPAHVHTLQHALRLCGIEKEIEL